MTRYRCREPVAIDPHAGPATFVVKTSDGATVAKGELTPDPDVADLAWLDVTLPAPPPGQDYWRIVLQGGRTIGRDYLWPDGTNTAAGPTPIRDPSDPDPEPDPMAKTSDDFLDDVAKQAAKELAIKSAEDSKSKVVADLKAAGRKVPVISGGDVHILSLNGEADYADETLALDFEPAPVPTPPGPENLQPAVDPSAPPPTA